MASSITNHNLKTNEQPYQQIGQHVSNENATTKKTSNKGYKLIKAAGSAVGSVVVSAGSVVVSAGSVVVSAGSAVGSAVSGFFGTSEKTNSQPTSNQQPTTENQGLTNLLKANYDDTHFLTIRTYPDEVIINGIIELLEELNTNLEEAKKNDGKFINDVTWTIKLFDVLKERINNPERVKIEGLDNFIQKIQNRISNLTNKLDSTHTTLSDKLTSLYFEVVKHTSSFILGRTIQKLLDGYIKDPTSLKNRQIQGINELIPTYLNNKENTTSDPAKNNLTLILRFAAKQRNYSIVSNCKENWISQIKKETKLEALKDLFQTLQSNSGNQQTKNQDEDEYSKAQIAKTILQQPLEIDYEAPEVTTNEIIPSTACSVLTLLAKYTTSLEDFKGFLNNITITNPPDNTSSLSSEEKYLIREALWEKGHYTFVLRNWLCELMGFKSDLDR